MTAFAATTAHDPALALPEVRHAVLSDVAAFLEEAAEDLTAEGASADVVLWAQSFAEGLDALRDGDVAALNAAFRTVAALNASTPSLQAVRVFPDLAR